VRFFDLSTKTDMIVACICEIVNSFCVFCAKINRENAQKWAIFVGLTGVKPLVVKCEKYVIKIGVSVIFWHIFGSLQEKTSTKNDAARGVILLLLLIINAGYRAALEAIPHCDIAFAPSPVYVTFFGVTFCLSEDNDVMSDVVAGIVEVFVK
jgi:hypothetical protein